MTRSGCAGKYSVCFDEEEATPSGEVDFEVITSKEGGACVAMIRAPEGVIAKTMFCKQKAVLACQSSKNTVDSLIDEVKPTLIFFLKAKHNFCKVHEIENQELALFRNPSVDQALKLFFQGSFSRVMAKMTSLSKLITRESRGLNGLFSDGLSVDPYVVYFVQICVKNLYSFIEGISI